MQMNQAIDAPKPFTLLVGRRIQAAHRISMFICVHPRLTAFSRINHLARFDFAPAALRLS